MFKLIHNHIIRMLAVGIYVSGISGAFAQATDYDFFFSKTINNIWVVKGSKTNIDTKNKEHPICFADSVMSDGTEFRFTKDLDDGEVYIYIYNPEWVLKSQVDDQKQIRINAYRGKKVVKGQFYNWVVVSKNQIVLPGLTGDYWVDIFFEADRINIVMPGDNQNLTFYIGPGRDVMRTLIACFDAFNKLPKPPKPSLDGKPADVMQKGKI